VRRPITEGRAVRIAYADALRAFAIFCVFLHHMFQQTLLTAKFREAAVFGYWGVDCFFVLTGFLLCGPYLRAIADGTPLPAWRPFAARRFLRIYPLYFVALVLSVADLEVHMQSPSFLDVGAHLLMLHGFVVPYITQINGPLWTMAVDAQFYVLMPIVLFAFNALVRAKPAAVRVRSIWLFLAAIAAASILERFVAVSLLTLSGTATWDADAVYARNVFGMSTNFAIGAALAFLAVRRPKPAQPRAWYAAAVGLGVVFIGLQTASLGVDTTRASLSIGTYGLIDVPGACSVGLFIYGLTRGGWSKIDAVVASPFVAELAALAYAVYLFQEPLINHVVSFYHGPLGNPLVTLGLGIVSLVVVYAVAVPMHRFVEQPFLDMREHHREVVPTLP
jgi:peptidoglycan/LPS O-acetylase OafA/YrhL